MLQILEHQRVDIALQIVAVQVEAYQEEARLIGFSDIPQLTESKEDIMKSKEVFIGEIIEGKLAGVLSFEKENERLTICRLVVRPHYFRKGIGSRLLTHVLQRYSKCECMVSTAEKNTPAIKLYEAHRFSIIKHTAAADNLVLVTMKRD
ncbi:GNAT family N-acetyltransferase [Priestia megaterium]|uniref:GNAT family N-acetyltransferase n=1 Tax=Priestia megaterium TaxID=1404 RepID=UPI000BF72BF9|nr:GNAT family N-acetyltransferase [Priestia megaterium]MCP1450554.1 ribosomal protein S18 acetylase RimI-like enzyme [Priestia megaterium]MED4047599.1 GNAT family N-acetyltransferase [Priestia megaterium]MED4062511.1 GNAT family N-acetyltransferase [Priestia megaterium]PFD99451.1 GNAT family N-acetyltransferase [Priestia megaterium]WJD82074.1 GNAT family N-acetyltransferase [Priestia megaterium]